MKRLSGQRIEPEADGLTHAHIVPVTFSDTNCEIHLRWVQYLCDRASGLHLVSRPVIRQGHAAEEESARCIHVALNGDESVHGGDDVHAVEVLLRLIHGELRLIQFFLRKKNRGLARGMMRFNVVFQLGQHSVCLLKGKIIFLPIDLADESVTADQMPESSWLQLAEELLAKGDCRLALRALYLAGLNYLGQKDLISVRRWKSGRDYRQELERRSRAHALTDANLTPAFARNLFLFERGWYGRHAVDRADVEAFAQGWEEIRRYAGRP